MIPVLVGLGVLIGGAILLTSWKSVVEWLQNFVTKLKKVWEEVRPLVPSAAVMYGDLIVNGADVISRIMHKLYYKEGEDWIEETTTCKVSENEVPEAIRKKLSMNEESDITTEMEKELQLTI